MNLNSAVLLSERFLSQTGDTGLFSKINELLEAGNSALADGSKEQLSGEEKASLAGQAKNILALLDDSVFSDPAMRVFPEHEQLGFSNILDGKQRDILNTIAEDENLSIPFLETGLLDLGNNLIQANELADQISTLMSVAEYFGVEKRESFDADAIAVIQMPQKINDADGGVNTFIDLMQSFQSIVKSCETDDTFDNNIRMISGEDPLIVADMSVPAAGKLQQFVSEAKRTEANVSEIKSARERLEAIGVRQEILEKLDEESGLFRQYDTSTIRGFLSSMFGDDSGDAARDMAKSVYDLMEAGVRVDSVVLNPEAEADNAMETAAMEAATGEPTDDGDSVAEDAQAQETSETSAVEQAAENVETAESAEVTNQTETNDEAKASADAGEAPFRSTDETAAEAQEQKAETESETQQDDAVATESDTSTGGTQEKENAESVEKSETALNSETSSDEQSQAASSKGEETGAESDATSQTASSEEHNTQEAQQNGESETNGDASMSEGESSDAKEGQESETPTPPPSKNGFRSIWDTISNR